MQVYLIMTSSDGGSISKVGGPKSKNRFSSPIIKVGSGVARNFKKGGSIISTFFVERIFSAELI